MATTAVDVDAMPKDVATFRGAEVLGALAAGHILLKFDSVDELADYAATTAGPPVVEMSMVGIVEATEEGAKKMLKQCVRTSDTCFSVVLSYADEKQGHVSYAIVVGGPAEHRPHAVASGLKTIQSLKQLDSVVKGITVLHKGDGDAMTAREYETGLTTLWSQGGDQRLHPEQAAIWPYTGKHSGKKAQSQLAKDRMTFKRANRAAALPTGAYCQFGIEDESTFYVLKADGAPVLYVANTGFKKPCERVEACFKEFAMWLEHVR